MRRVLLAAAVLAWAPYARAEIAVLENGMTLKAASHRAEGETVLLVLKGGGEVGLPSSSVRGFIPDEVLDEVESSAAAGGDLRALAAEAAPCPTRPWSWPWSLSVTFSPARCPRRFWGSCS
jgi:hypothetical protein